MERSVAKFTPPRELRRARRQRRFQPGNKHPLTVFLNQVIGPGGKTGGQVYPHPVNYGVPGANGAFDLVINTR